LKTFGAPTHAVTESDFALPGITFQIGVEPVRIDIITAVDIDGRWGAGTESALRRAAALVGMNMQIPHDDRLAYVPFA
jgi:hypothetical protein